MCEITWTRAVKQRDGGICVVCGSPGVNAHHIYGKNYIPELNLMVENGVTLCRKCHIWVHRGSFCGQSKYKHSAEESVEKLMARSASPSVRPLVERLVAATGITMRAADMLEEKRNRHEDVVPVDLKDDVIQLLKAARCDILEYIPDGGNAK